MTKDVRDLIAEAREALARINIHAFPDDLAFQYRGGVLGRNITEILRDVTSALEATLGEREAATAELEAQLANAKAGWDSALRIVNEGNEIIKQVGAERDAAVAAIERIRVAVSGNPECDRYEDGDVTSCGWKSAYARVVASLDGAPEPEWEAVAEYGVKYAPTNNRASYTVRFGYESREDAEYSLGRLGRNQKRNPDRLMYREVRTGPWLPVEGESNDA